MKTLTFLIATVLLTSCMGSYSKIFNASGNANFVKGSKNCVTKNIKVDNSFDQLKINANSHIYYIQQSGAPRVEVYTSDNILPLLDIKVKDETLCIGFKKEMQLIINKLDIRISSPNLKDIILNGSGNVEWTKGIRTDDFRITINGSGNVNGETLHCKHLECCISGSGNINVNSITSTSTKAAVSGSGTITLSGKTETGAYSISGSGTIHTASLQAWNASASVNGSGYIECHAHQTLKANVSGSGRIGYKGKPAIKNRSNKKKRVYTL